MTVGEPFRVTVLESQPSGGEDRTRSPDEEQLNIPPDEVGATTPEGVGSVDCSAVFITDVIHVNTRSRSATSGVAPGSSR